MAYVEKRKELSSISPAFQICFPFSCFIRRRRRRRDRANGGRRRRRGRRRLQARRPPPAAFIAGAIQEARGLLAELAAAEDDDDRRRQLSSSRRRGGCSSSASSYQIDSLLWQLDGLTQDLDGLRWHMDPWGRWAPGHCSRALRTLCYHAEDSLDALALRRRGGGGEGRQWWAVKKLSLRVAVELGAIKSRAAAATKRLLDSPWAADTATAAVVVPAEEEEEEEAGFRRRLPPHPTAAAPPGIIVGVDAQRDELARTLLSGRDPAAEECSELEVVAVVGDEGAGKTALVGEVYRAVGGSFECRAWVSVGSKKRKNRSSVTILNDVARQVGAPVHKGGDGEAWRNVGSFLRHKRYLIVLDGIEFDTWRLIREDIPSNRLGSRVVTTMCNDSVLYYGDESPQGYGINCIFHISPLSRACSRALFHARIFGSEATRCPPELVDVADKIMEKCGGMPLAINIVSGLLANKPCSRSVWEGVDRSIGSGGGRVETTKNICLLGYFALPHHLRTCLLYLSVFPEDCPISRDRAVRSWIAEGFVSHEHGRTVEEVGESYFDDLVYRSMIQPVHGSYYEHDDGNKPAEVYYMIHGMVRYPIRRELTRENFVTLLDNGENASRLRSRIHRLSVNNASKDCGIPESMDISRIRSLFIFGRVMPTLSFKHLTFLRVLDLEGCKDLENRNVVEIADELSHLRYLSIRDTPISKLPDQIGELQNLTMLDIRGTLVQELPESVARLQRLTHLFCDKMRFREWMGKIAALSCLSQFDIFQSETVAMEQLGNLSELRELGIWWSPCAESSNTERYEHFAISLYRLKNLQSLCVHGSGGSVDLLDHLHHPLRRLQKFQLSGSYYANRIPQWFRSLPMLAYLCIDVKKVKNEDLQLLSELPSLRHLSLSCRDIPTEQLVISSNGFSVLRELQLCSVRADLAFEPHAMQKLQSLLLSLHVLPEETYGFSISIDQFICLKKIEIQIYGKGVDACKLAEAVNVAIRNAAEEHPNHPTVSIIAVET
ncbi:unnamed protein product [Urochloa humidicola]